MKTRMSVRLNKETGKAVIILNTVYDGKDKIREFGEFEKKYQDSKSIGMVWDNLNGQYKAEIECTPEKAKPFNDFCIKNNIEMILI